MQPYIPGSLHAFAGAKRYPISYHFFIVQGGESLATIDSGETGMKGRYGWSTLVLLLGTSGHGLAQDAADSVPRDNNLPAIRIEAPPAPRPARRADRDRGGERRNRAAVQRTPTPQHVTVDAPTPLPGPSQVPLEKAFDADKVPGTLTTIDTSQISRTNSLNITNSLQHYIPGVSVSSVGGNDFAPNVEFRGYVASPVSGTPQGLAVYQNGVRINEAFGDTINWDLIPTAAIRSVTMVTNDPAYGLNALGGALNIQMKNGFNYHGAGIDVMGGSYGRVQTSLQWGKQINEWAIYGAFEAIHDDGYRLFSESNLLALLRRYRPPQHGQRDSPQHRRGEQQLRRRRHHARRIVADSLERGLHDATDKLQPGRLSEPDRPV